MGLELTNPEIVTWAEVGCSTDWATQAPLLFIYLTERPRAREGQRERETQNLKQVPGSELSARSPAWGSNLRTRDHDLSHSWTLGAPGRLTQLSIWFWLRSQSRGLWVWAPHWVLCWQLRAWNLLQIQCLPLSLSHPRSCSVSLSLSKMNKH